MQGASFGRRRFLALLAGLTSAPQVRGQAPPLTPHLSRLDTGAKPFAPALPGHVMRFPDDEGSHPDFRVEWWYVTGWLHKARSTPLGFQITFFRARPSRSTDNPSAFNPRQILIAHAAISDPARGRLQQDQCAARAAFDLAGARVGRTDVWIDDWSLRQRDGHYLATIAARGFRLELALAATQKPLLHGAAGYSQKGPRPASASHYYSLPQLDTTGTIVRDGKPEAGHGVAWLDHEWSSSYLDEGAVGWDWIGINFDDGGALMAFQMRSGGGEILWSGGTYRSTAGEAAVLPSESVRFTPLRRWRSPRTGADYPVAWRVRAGDREIKIEPAFDDQENDTRATTGTIYWEGAVRALLSGKPIGRGYLELTGYWRPMQL